MSAINMKACPFCGATWEFVDDDGYMELWHEDWCFMRTMTDGHRGCVEDTKLLERWNTREEPAYVAGFKDGRAMGGFK